MIVKKYNRGEMYWYINPDVDKKDFLKDGENQDFLDNRPVLIISDYVDEYDSSVIIISCTTSDHRYGIDISFINDKGEKENTKLMPMRIRTVPIKYLKKYIGKVDAVLLEKVYDAIDYHYGRTNIVPNYVIEDKKIHKEINDHKQLSESMVNKINIQYPELDKIRKKVKNKLAKLPGDGYSEMKDAVFSILSTNKSIRRIYGSIQSHKDRFKCLSMNVNDIAKRYKITVNQAITIKELCSIEFAIEQLKLIDKLNKHELPIRSFNNKNKITFLSIDNSILNTIIKKGDPVINKYKAEFYEELLK